MADWTAPQRAAIEDDGGGLLVCASAGSGKTAVLVQRALRMLTGPAPIPADRLLILTFSNAAAAELRSRLALGLEQALRRGGGDLRLRRQQMLLQRASISTVSAFCMQLLRENFSALDIPPDFAVADEAAVFELRQNTLAAVLEESYQDPDFAAFGAVFGRARSDRQVGEALLSVYDHLRAMPFFDRALAGLQAQYEGAQPLAGTIWGRQLCAGAADGLAAGLSLCDTALRQIDEEPLLAAYRPALEADRACLQAAEARLAAGDWDGARAVLQGYGPVRLPAVRGYEGGAKQLVQQLRSGVKDQIAAVLADSLICTSAEFEEDRRQLRPLVAALCRALHRFDRQFFAAKLEEKLLEFSDFEHLALQLLAGQDGAPTPLAAGLRARFDAVMVDEYQDTNALQDRLYSLLAAPGGENLFLVGDVKQSIYRFRKAMPELFLEKKARFYPYDGRHYPASLALPHNFRSSGAVIEAVNGLFGCLMSRRVGELDYTGAERLQPGGPEQDTGLPGARLLVVDVAEDPLFGEADAVAEQILQMVRGGEQVRGADGRLRRCGFGDFCILLRSPRPVLALYTEALAARGVPAYADLGEGVLTLPEVQPLLAALRVLDNPAQDVPLAALMTSPMFGFTSGELAALRAETPAGSLFGAVAASGQARVQAFYRQLLQLRGEAAFLPVDAVCERVLQATGYLLAVQVAEGGEGGGEARRGAVEEFVRLAAGYAAAGSGGLAGFLRSVDNALSAHARPQAGGAKPPAGHVAIFSIHRSKGLEFPVCILADTARSFNKKELYTAPVLRHTRLGVGLCLRTPAGARYPTAPQRAIRQALEQEQLSEEMRVLYVALTRARDRLLITVASRDPAGMLNHLAVSLLGAGGLTPQLVAGAAGFGQWLCLAALTLPGGLPLRQAAGALQLPAAGGCGPGAFSAELVKAPGHLQAAQRAEVRRSAAPDPALAAALKRHFEWEYPRKALLEMPAKTSVSALLQQRELQQPGLKRPAFLAEGGLSAAERGTALHRVLQLMDFAAARADLAAELGRLQAAGMVSAAQAGAVDRAALGRFLASPLMDSILSADRLLREYAFFTRLPAGSLAPLQGPLASEPVLVQGVADCVVEKGGELFLIDYKTDRGKSPAQLLQAYAPQLQLYRQALQRRLGLPVVRCSLYAFALGREIPVF